MPKPANNFDRVNAFLDDLCAVLSKWDVALIAKESTPGEFHVLNHNADVVLRVIAAAEGRRIYSPTTVDFPERR